MRLGGQPTPTPECDQDVPPPFDSIIAGKQDFPEAAIAKDSMTNLVVEHTSGLTRLHAEGSGVLHALPLHRSAVWNPCSHGPLAAISISINGSVPAEQRGETSIRPAVQQAGSTFFAEPRLAITGASGGAGAQSWEVEPSEFRPLTGSASLNWIDGTEVRFGYLVGVSCPETSTCGAVSRSFELSEYRLALE